MRSAWGMGMGWPAWVLPGRGKEGHLVLLPSPEDGGLWLGLSVQLRLQPRSRGFSGFKTQSARHFLLSNQSQLWGSCWGRQSPLAKVGLWA